MGLMTAIHNIENFSVSVCALQDFPCKCGISSVPDIVFIASSAVMSDKQRLAVMRKKWPAAIIVQMLPPCKGWDCPEQLALSAKREKSAADIILVRHAFEMVDIFDFKKLQSRYGDFRMPLFAHFPYASNAQEYYPVARWQDRTRDLLDLRSVDAEVSPSDLRSAKMCLLSR